MEQKKSGAVWRYEEGNKFSNDIEREKKETKRGKCRSSVVGNDAKAFSVEFPLFAFSISASLCVYAIPNVAA